jgi:hypothetical protein
MIKNEVIDAFYIKFAIVYSRGNPDFDVFAVIKFRFSVSQSEGGTA